MTEQWLRSSFCADNACVEVRADGDDVLMRDSKNGQDPLRFTRREWVAFVNKIRA